MKRFSWLAGASSLAQSDRKWSARGTAILATMLFLLATAPWAPSQARAQANDKPIPIRIGIQAQTSWLLYAAKALHFFEKAGLAPTYVKFNTGAQMIAAMQGRSIDVGSPGIVPFIAGLSQGVTWKVIGLDTEFPTAEGFVARGDTSIKTLRDLKGKTIGVSRGSTSYYALLAALKNKGIQQSEVKLLLLDPPTQYAAMLNKDVDAVAVWEPWIQKLVTGAGARLIGMESDYDVYTTCAVYAVDADYVKEKPEAVRRYLRALLMAYDNIQKNGPGPATDAIVDAMGISKEMANAIYKEAGAPNIRRWNDATYRYSIVKTGPYAKVAQQVANFLYEQHISAKRVDVAATFDDTFIGEVLKSAGR